MVPELLDEPLLIAGWAPSAAPPPLLRVSEWADAKRILPESSAARGARWQTDRAPYLRGIMDAVHEPGVRTIAVMKAAQTGGSEALHNIVGYHIEHDPAPILFVHPTIGQAEEWSKERLADMLRTTRSLTEAIREDESTLTLKMFAGGYLALGGANTPNTFARRAVRIAVGDDVDRFPPVVGEEGDPADLLVDRTRTFDDPLVIFVSTPTLARGRIDTLYARSDKRRFFVACPECGREDWIGWSAHDHFRVVFEHRDPDTARLECPSEEFGGCGARLYEHERRAMIIEAGRRADAWRSTAVAQQTGLVGFHLPAMISLLGVTLPQLVDQWLSAHAKGKESQRVFINTTLGEAWEDKGARREPDGLMAKRESYGEGVEVPEPAVALTCGVDVQDDRFELQVMGWGPAEERWVVDYRVINGDVKKQETQDQLWAALQRKYAHASGVMLPIHGTCIDSGDGDHTDAVYDFVLRYQAHRVWATKGYSGRSGEPIVGKPSEKRYGRRPRPVRVYPVNVDDAKGDVMNALTKEKHGPRSMHFSIERETINEEYFAQLCAEHRETRYNSAGVATHSVWVKHRERNEALDTAVLAFAAYRLLNPNVRQMAEVLAALVGERPAARPAAGVPRTSSRVVRSAYLQHQR